MTRTNKGTSRVWEVFAVIFFSTAIVAFLGAVVYWIKKKQESVDSKSAVRLCVTPDALKEKIEVRLKDKVEYSFWKPYVVPPMERQKVLRQCLQQVQGYLGSPDIVAKSNYVWNSEETLPLMVRHYAVEPPERLGSQTTGAKRLTFLEVEGRPSVHLLLGFKKTPDMEFCFFQDDSTKEWKLDWQQFARYQPEEWEKFVQGDGLDMGQFRVWLFREKVAETRDEYALRVIAPGVNGTDARSIGRPLVMVPKKSDLGRKVYMLFKLNEDVYTSPYRVINANDEEGALRVRAVLSRSAKPINSSGEYGFDLVKILGEGWYGVPCKDTEEGLILMPEEKKEQKF